MREEEDIYISHDVCHEGGRIYIYRRKYVMTEETWVASYGMREEGLRIVGREGGGGYVSYAVRGGWQCGNR